MTEEAFLKLIRSNFGHVEQHGFAIHPLENTPTYIVVEAFSEKIAIRWSYDNRDHMLDCNVLPVENGVVNEDSSEDGDFWWEFNRYCIKALGVAAEAVQRIVESAQGIDDTLERTLQVYKATFALIEIEKLRKGTFPRIDPTFL